jgi:hypothetical protein
MAAIGEDNGLGPPAAGHVNYFAVVSAFVDNAFGGGGIWRGYSDGATHGQYIAESNVNQFNTHIVTSYFFLGLIFTSRVKPEAIFTSR